jgi:Holliday junction resolvase
MPHIKKATDEEIVQAYRQDNNIWRVAKKLGMCGQSVWERLKKLGELKSMNLFTQEEESLLRENYATYAEKGDLEELAKLLNRTKNFICRKAQELGLTNQGRKKGWLRIPDKIIKNLFEKYRKSKRFSLNIFCHKNNIAPTTFWHRCKELFPDEWEAVVELHSLKSSKYRLGRALEYRIRDFLRQRGFVVVRTPQSKGPFDLIAIKKGLVLLVQSKRNGQITLNDRNILFELAESIGAKALIAGMPGVKGIEFWEIECRATKKNEGRKRILFDEWINTCPLN